MADLYCTQMTPDDLPAVVALENECFEDPWLPSMFQEELSLDKSHYFVLRADGEIVGYGGFWKIIDEGHIMNIAIHPRHRGKGYGSYILSHMLSVFSSEEIKLWFLEVRVSNAPAIALYERFGFLRYHTRKHYYQNNGEDALLMMKAPPQEA